MKILLSKQDFLKERVTLIESVSKQSAKVTAGSGLTFEVDLFKLSLLSPLLRCIKDSLSVPDSLNHLLDINIIFPDFSEEALSLLSQSFSSGFGSNMLVGMVLYEELQLLVNALGIALHPSLSIPEDQISTDMNSNKTDKNTEEIVVLKVESTKVVLIDIEDDELEGNLVEKSACTYEGRTSLASLRNPKGGTTVEDDIPKAQMIFTLSADDSNEYRNELMKLMVSEVNKGRKLWSCTVCGKFEKEAIDKRKRKLTVKNMLKHLDSKHTPHILHRCAICFKKIKKNVFNTQDKFKKNVFNTRLNLDRHMVKQHASFESSVEDFASASGR